MTFQPFKSLKVQCDGAFWRHIYDFYYWLPIKYSLLGTSMRYKSSNYDPTMSVLEKSNSISLKVDFIGAVGLPIYNFQLMSNSNYMSISKSLAAFSTWNCVPMSFIRPQIRTPHTHPYPGASFVKIEWFYPCVTGKVSTKNEVDWFNTFWKYFANGHRDTQIHTNPK